MIMPFATFDAIRAMTHSTAGSLAESGFELRIHSFDGSNAMDLRTDRVSFAKRFRAKFGLKR